MGIRPRWLVRAIGAAQANIDGGKVKGGQGVTLTLILTHLGPGEIPGEPAIPHPFLAQGSSVDLHE